MSWLILGIGMVLVIEGLAIALAPSRLEDLIEFLQKIPLETRRVIGLSAIAGGVLLVWIARSLGV